MMLPGFFSSVAADVPVDPDAPTARDWILHELAGSEYQAAQPTWLDRLAGAISDWIRSLTVPAPGGGPGLAPVIIFVLVAVAIVVAFLVFGVPRLNRRSRATGSLFGDDDDRGSAALRSAAERAAASGDFAVAIAEMFRAIARGLDERTIVTTFPGTTARGFAVQAGGEFPDLAPRLLTAASAFDDVRYLGRPGSAVAYADVADLESALRAARPLLSGVTA
jgi:hypothetical protein